MEKAIIIILVGSLIGWITNYIAIKMLFKPYEEINLLVFKIQGLIPKRRKEIAESIAETIKTELLSIEDIKAKLINSNIESEIEKVINDILEKKLASEIISKFPMLSMFLNEATLEKIKDIIKNAILENKEQILEMLITTIEKNVDFKEIIIEKVNNFSLMELERITIALAKRELKHIEIIGAILGGVIGIVQFVIVTII